MTKEDLFPKLENLVEITLKDRSKVTYAVTDDAVKEVLRVLGRRGCYFPLSVMKT